MSQLKQNNQTTNHSEGEDIVRIQTDKNTYDEYYRIDGQKHKGRQLYKDARGNNYFIDEKGEMRGVGQHLQLVSRAKKHWQKLKSHTKKVGLKRKEAKEKFKKVLQHIRDSPALQRDLRQLSDGPNADTKDLPVALAVCINECMNCSDKLPLANVVSVEKINGRSGTKEQGESDKESQEEFDKESQEKWEEEFDKESQEEFDKESDKESQEKCEEKCEEKSEEESEEESEALMLENAINSALYEIDVISRATQETLVLTSALVSELNDIAGVLMFKTGEGTVVVVKEGGKLVMGLLEVTKGPAGVLGRTALRGASAALEVAKFGGRTAIKGGSEILRLTGTFVKFLFSGSGGGDDDPEGDDPEGSENDSSDDNEDQKNQMKQKKRIVRARRTRQRQRAASPSPPPSPPRNKLSQKRQLRKLDNPGPGRLWEKVLGEQGQGVQTDEERNKAQRAARIARAKKRRGERLYEPQFKQFVLN